MKTAPAPRRRLPDHVAEAIAAVIEFFWMEQTKDYLARNREEQQKHIFNEMLTVRQWLSRQNSKQWRTNRND